MDSVRDTLAGGLPHSEISGSGFICQLPGAFRRLSRLSSPVVAKASTVCARSLDPLTRTPVDLSTVFCDPSKNVTHSPDWVAVAGGLRALLTLSTRLRAWLLRTFHVVKEQVGLVCQAPSARAETPGHPPVDGRGFPFGNPGPYRGGVVEPGGFEPPTPGLQSRCSPG